MQFGLTEASEHEFERITSERMTPELAAACLREDQIRLRKFSELLSSLYVGTDLRSRLTAGLCALSTDQNPESIARTVRNWLSDRSLPSDRETVFRISFVLELSEEQTSRLLGFCAGYGLHYRDGREAVYAFFLRHQLSYEEACTFFDSLPPIPHLDDDPPNAPSNLSRDLTNQFLLVRTQEELRTCYLQNLQKMGRFHLRAWEYFKVYMGQLIQPTSPWSAEEEEVYSVERVMELYFRMHMPAERKRSSYGVAQRLIKANWPNATVLRAVFARKQEVTRKLLLLLYVITENIGHDTPSSFSEENDTLAARVEEHWWSLNAMLMDCGMPPVDPRNAMDWLVLYAITADEEAMSERMESVIAELFD